jgi:hypothetical protein
LALAATGQWMSFNKVALLAPNTIPSWVVSEGTRIGFNMSRGDLYIEAVDESFGIHFCHDSDIHVEGTSVEAVAILERRWRGLGFPGYVFVGDQWVTASSCSSATASFVRYDAGRFAAQMREDDSEQQALRLQQGEQPAYEVLLEVERSQHGTAA